MMNQIKKGTDIEIGIAQMDIDLRLGIEDDLYGKQRERDVHTYICMY
jgi:hypothetical protein